jgi:hypothetical protein
LVMYTWVQEQILNLWNLLGNTILCDYKDADCTVQENINLGKHRGTGKLRVIYGWMYSNWFKKFM